MVEYPARPGRGCTPTTSLALCQATDDTSLRVCVTRSDLLMIVQPGRFHQGAPTH